MTNRNPNGDDTVRDLVTRSFVISREQDDALKRLAKLNHRTFSGELRLVVDNHLAANAAVLEEAA